MCNTCNATDELKSNMSAIKPEQEVWKLVAIVSTSPILASQMTRMNLTDLDSSIKSITGRIEAQKILTLFFGRR